ncbi:uncharacterized protein PAC_17017 [Phialocephala subalpina]|uniref:Uncharacterized protein n=1 Tax=Phialocephala subalpina TaxID=576137 RepID=A0A1L7XQ75_9HELO|nr:uncharacterized protein PAC_17017 [Phialocephala subalpina]
MAPRKMIEFRMGPTKTSEDQQSQAIPHGPLLPRQPGQLRPRNRILSERGSINHQNVILLGLQQLHSELKKVTGHDQRPDPLGGWNWNPYKVYSGVPTKTSRGSRQSHESIERGAGIPRREVHKKMREDDGKKYDHIYYAIEDYHRLAIEPKYQPDFLPIETVMAVLEITPEESWSAENVGNVLAKHPDVLKLAIWQLRQRNKRRYWYTLREENCHPGFPLPVKRSRQEYCAWYTHENRFGDEAKCPDIEDNGRGEGLDRIARNVSFNGIFDSYCLPKLDISSYLIIINLRALALRILSRSSPCHGREERYFSLQRL